ncbi:MAG: anaerobic sulfite reductase subunit AsrA [Fusobacteriaceae bacterium]
MKKVFTNGEFNSIVNSLSKEYDIYAPITLPYKGTFSDTNLVKYGKISSLEEINLKDKSHFSAKEIILPITQTLFYFTEKEYIKPEIDPKKILILLRSCDLHSVNRLDNIYLNNKFSDTYYSEMKNKIKFAVIGCPGQGWDSCFCASMGTNTTDAYDLGFTFKENEIYVDIKNEEFSESFSSGTEKDFKMEFVEENIEKVNVPENLELSQVVDLEMWRDYDRCIACGRCNFVCPTCTCFTTQDVFYKENEKNGERRRVWASCHVDKFTTMAGNHEFRKKTGDRMRFKVMHKISDYKKRFGTHMCTGCGRCEDACPEYISYINCINKLNKKVGDINE